MNTGGLSCAGSSPRRRLSWYRRAGFRFQGWPLDAAAARGEMRLTLRVTTSRPSKSSLALPDPLPAAEFKALGAHLLESSLKSLAGDNDYAK